MEIENKNPHIFLIGGKARHGKDTFSSYLKNVYEKNGKKVLVTQLSKYIKYYAREMTGWNLTEEDKPRELLQKLGTDIIRVKLKKEDLFINRMIDDIEIFSYFYDAIIISDVRFPIEIDKIKDSFNDAYAIKVFRPNFDNGLTPLQQQHPTETALDEYDKFDYEVINTTFESLEEYAETIYTERNKGV